MKQETFFSIIGRIRRKEYLKRVLLLSILSALISVTTGMSQEQDKIIFTALISLVMTYLIAIQVIKRLHDINMNGWYWFVFLIPLVNIVFGLYILFKDGTVGSNKYGEDPKGRLEKIN